MYGIIATWRMAKEGIELADEMLKKGEVSGKAIETAIKAVEDFPYYKSVGYGGLPNEEQIVELDAGYMDGDTMSVGALGAIKDFANPISIAKKLSEEKVNNLLVGAGAEKYAKEMKFEEKEMLTDRAKAFYRKRKKEMDQELKPYDGHDTVGMVCLDTSGTVTAATSTSGLFMKRSGRVGDSPIVGSGFYADSEVGGATATGLGEDLMKGCISYEIVRLMKEGLDRKLREKRGEAGDLSVVAMNCKGEFGCATNIGGFSFSVATQEQEPVVYLVTREEDGHCSFREADQEWLEEYMRVRMAPVQE